MKKDNWKEIQIAIIFSLEFILGIMFALFFFGMFGFGMYSFVLLQGGTTLQAYVSSLLITIIILLHVELDKPEKIMNRIRKKVYNE